MLKSASSASASNQRATRLVPVTPRPSQVVAAATRPCTAGRGAHEELVPEDPPSVGQRPPDPGGRQDPTDRGHGSRAADQGRVSCRGDALIGQVRADEGAAVPCRGASGRADDGLGGRAAARHCLRDAFALQGVDETGGIADQEHPAGRRPGPDHPHLEPAAQLARESGEPSPCPGARGARDGRRSPEALAPPRRRPDDSRVSRSRRRGWRPHWGPGTSIRSRERRRHAPAPTGRSPGGRRAGPHSTERRTPTAPVAHRRGRRRAPRGWWRRRRRSRSRRGVRRPRRS